MNPRGKVALITGGAHRVGRAITLKLAEAGAHVVINYAQSHADALQTARDAEEVGVIALPVQADVADSAAVRDMAGQVVERFGGVDIIVNSASLFLSSPFPTQDLDVWSRVIGVELFGPLHVCNVLAPSMQARGGGAIVNILDLGAWHPWPGMGAHGVGKAGLLALTRQLALELAPSTRVNGVAAGPVLPPPQMDERRQAAVAARTLLRRWGRPEDVSGAVHYLVTADYVTGSVITVDGGERLGQAAQDVGVD